MPNFPVSVGEEPAPFQALIEKITDVICLSDADGSVTYASPSIQQILGFNAGDLLKTSSFDLFHPDDRHRCEAMFRGLLEKPGTGRRFEARLRHKDGGWRWMEARATNLIDDPAIGAVVLNYRDITDRKRAEQALKSSESEFRTFFEMIGVGTVEAEPVSGQFLRVNPKFCELVGYSGAELQQKSLRDLIHPDDAKECWAAWSRCVEEGCPEYTLEMRLLRLDGSDLWAQVTTTVLHDGEGRPSRSLAVVRDVSDRRHAVAELERARSDLADRVQRRTAELQVAKGQLETLIAASPLSIVSLDRDLRVRTWNRAAENLFGWSEAEVIGQPLPNFPREVRQKYLEELRNTPCHAPVTTFETRCRRRDGAMVEVNVWRAPLYDSQEKPTGCMAIIMDVTERKRLERALLEAGEREQRRLGQDLHDHLCQHLLGVACVLKAIATTAGNEGSKSAATLRQAAQLVNDAVQQARDIARGLHPVELDAAGLMSALRELANRVNSTVPCDLECERPVLIDDPEAAMHIYRIAQEATANAVKHARATRIDIRLREDRDGITLQVQDNGTGLDGPRPSGSGMGLEMMKYRAHAIGGRLFLESQPSGGTRVTCTLPKNKQ